LQVSVFCICLNLQLRLGHGAYPREKPYKVLQYGKVPSLTKKYYKRLKVLERENALAYFKPNVGYKEKKFFNIVIRNLSLKLFTDKINSLD
jgi:hypothetical protein